MQPFDAESHVRVAAPQVGIELTPAECRDVAVQLERIHAFAQLVLELDIGPEDGSLSPFAP